METRTNLDSHDSRAKGLPGLITIMLKNPVFIAIETKLILNKTVVPFNTGMMRFLQESVRGCRDQ